MSDDTIKASFTELFEQGDITATAYMRNARKNIDKEFGEGYAAEHPELVAAYMTAAVKDVGNSSALKVAQGIARTAFDIDDLTSAVDKLAEAHAKLAEAHAKIPYQLQCLGTGNAGSEVGAIEFLGIQLKHVAEALESIGAATETIAGL